MEPTDVQALYGGDYAARYDQIWQESDRWGAEAGHHLRSLRELVGPETRWLDVGCGTGWNLSHFPGVTRGGLDLSPDMLAQARTANPDALFLREGDIRDDVEEWHDAWDLVTCTGQPWSYLRTMDEIESALTNLARWTAPDGTCWAPMGDLTDLTGQPVHVPLPGEPPLDDAPMITGVIWSLHESQRDHIHMIWPSVGWCVGVMARHFRRVEIRRWPHDPPWIPVARRVLVATEKRRPGDDTPATIVEHPVPEPDPVEPGPDPVEPEPAPDPVAAVEPVGPVGPVATVEPSGRIAGRRLVDQPFSYVVGRIRPWNPAFWRSVALRVRSRTGRG